MHSLLAFFLWQSVASDFFPAAGSLKTGNCLVGSEDGLLKRGWIVEAGMNC